MEILSDAEGAAQGIRRSAAFIRDLFTRIRRVPEVLQSNAGHWSEVGIHPHDLRLLIERQPRDTQTLARLLDVTADEVATLLEAQGFVQNEWSHLWEVDDTNEGATIRRIVKRVETVEWEHSTPERHEHLRHELTRIVEEEIGPESE